MRLLGRPGLVAVLGLLAGCVGALLYLTGVLSGLELDTADTRFQIRGPKPAENRVAVVEIDDSTFSELEEQWPFPRSLHAEVIRQLERAGARAIAYDVQFTEPTDPRQDNRLIKAVAEADGVVLATTEVDRQGRSRVFGGESVLRRIGARSANSNFDADADGVWRRLPYSMQGLPGFAVAAVEAATGRRYSRNGFGDDGAWIDYRGAAGSIPSVPFWRVLRGRFDPEMIDGRIVVVGASAPSLQDVHAVPVGGGELMSGPEIHANAIATLLDGVPLRSLGGLPRYC